MWRNSGGGSMGGDGWPLRGIVSMASSVKQTGTRGYHVVHGKHNTWNLWVDLWFGAFNEEINSNQKNHTIHRAESYDGRTMILNTGYCIIHEIKRPEKESYTFYTSSLWIIINRTFFQRSKDALPDKSRIWSGFPSPARGFLPPGHGGHSSPGSRIHLQRRHRSPSSTTARSYRRLHEESVPPAAAATSHFRSPLLHLRLGRD